MAVLCWQLVDHDFPHKGRPEQMSAWTRISNRIRFRIPLRVAVRRRTEEVAVIMEETMVGMV
eukprot:scaffold5684_cov169-Amphora_coffeaeformis.AAC.10